MFIESLILVTSFLGGVSPFLFVHAPLSGIPDPIAITFDDGPHPTYTNEILDILHREHVPATFFILGQEIRGKEGILQRILCEGHILGNHSYHHKNLPKLPLLGVINEVMFTDIRAFLVTGTWLHYFRFPYGNIDPRVSLVHMGPLIAWNVDAYDWKAKNPHALASKIVAQVKPGSIILLHDIKKDTVLALPEIVASLKKKWYHFVSLKSLLAGKEKSRTLYYSQGTNRALPKFYRISSDRQPKEYHPKGTEASQETLRF